MTSNGLVSTTPLVRYSPSGISSLLGVGLGGRDEFQHGIAGHERAGADAAHLVESQRVLGVDFQCQQHAARFPQFQVGDPADFDAVLADGRIDRHTRCRGKEDVQGVARRKRVGPGAQQRNEDDQ